MKNRLMKRLLQLALVALVVGVITSFTIVPKDTTEADDWGFYGHRLINRMAVFCLPQDLLPFYKKNIEYISEHAVDPDKRRYATKHEAVRHYIDIDAWGTFPFDNVPRDFQTALAKYSHYKLVDNLDTVQLIVQIKQDTMQLLDADSSLVMTMDKDRFRRFFSKQVFPQYYEDEWIVPADSVWKHLNLYGTLLVEDHFSQDGILPYHLSSMKWKLTQAFIDQDVAKVLRTSAEFGHYIGDAHVPLHTTTNYNGQLTDQVGIHAFWESRIPELFAESQYSFLTGKAKYIEDTRTYFWQMILDSHEQLEDVLKIEKELSRTFPSDKQYCYDERLGRTIRVQCPEYAAAYQQRMNGMVEARMQDAIGAIGNIWFTCWVDAGQPNLLIEKLDIEPEPIIVDKNVKVRAHE